MNAPLTGLRVVDLTQMMSGPLCTMMLGDLGADIIKVEPPGGEPIRHTGDTRLGGETEYTLSLNRNKRSIVLDLKTPEGVDDVKRLIAQCDILVENFRPGTTERLGIGWETLAELNPRLIYCSMSGFGETSVHRDRPALDPVVQAMSGIMQLTGTEESGPLRTGFALGDFVASVFGLSGVLAALYERQATGAGKRVGVSMMDASIFSMVPREGYFFATGKTPARIGNGHYQIVPYNAYTTSDGREIFLLAPMEKFWHAIVAAIGDPVLAHDRFRGNAKRVANRVEVESLLKAAFASDTAAVWLERLRNADALFSLVRTFDEVFDDPEVRRNIVREVEHPSAGTIRVLSNPICFDSAYLDIRCPPPLLGEHSDELRREFGLHPAP